MPISPVEKEIISLVESIGKERLEKEISQAIETVQSQRSFEQDLVKGPKGKLPIYSVAPYIYNIIILLSCMEAKLEKWGNTLIACLKYDDISRTMTIKERLEILQDIEAFVKLCVQNMIEKLLTASTEGEKTNAFEVLY